MTRVGAPAWSRSPAADSRRRIRAVTVSGVLAVMAGIGTLALQPHARADVPDETFSATALAYGIDAETTNPSIPLGVTIEGIGPTAQSELDSLQQGTALASFPYPGQTVAGLPGVAGGLVGAPIPAYPLYVSTDYGAAPADQSAPGITLHAECELLQSLATATTGQTSSGLTSTAKTVEADDGTVTTTADSSADGLDLAGSVVVTGMRSHVEAVRDPSGKLTTSSSLTIGNITAPGLSVTIPSTVPGVGGETIPAANLGFSDGNFTVTVPAPGGTTVTEPVPANTALAALSAAGVTATYQPAHQRDNGIDGATISLATTVPSPPSNPGVNGPTNVTYRFGRASVIADLTPIPEDNDTDTVFPAGPSTTTAPPASSAVPASDAPAASSVPAPVVTAGQPPAGTTGQLPVAGGNAPASTTLAAGSTPVTQSVAQPENAPIAAARPAAATRPAAFFELFAGDPADIYLALVMAALVGAVSAAVFRSVGMRSL